MSDLVVVNIPAVTVTAEKPKLTTKEDFTNLKIYADAFRRGEISREKIPYKFRIHLPQTQEKAQDIAYQQHKDEKKAQEILKQQGWDKLEKAYGIGGSALIAAPIVTDAIVKAAPAASTIVSNISSGITHGLNVLANPMTAKTTAGFLTASGIDALGTIYGINRNSELLNKWANGQFNWSDIPEFGLNLLPGYGVGKGSPIVAKNIMGSRPVKNISLTLPRIKTAYVNYPNIRQHYNIQIKPRIRTAEDGVKEIQLMELTPKPHLSEVFKQMLDANRSIDVPVKVQVDKLVLTTAKDALTGNIFTTSIKVPFIETQHIPAGIKLRSGVSLENIWKRPIQAYIPYGDINGRNYAGLYTRDSDVAKIDIGSFQLPSSTGVHELGHRIDAHLDPMHIDGINRVEPFRSALNILSNSVLEPEAQWLKTLNDAKKFKNEYSINVSELRATAKQFLSDQFLNRMSGTSLPPKNWDGEFLKLVKDEILEMDDSEFLNRFVNTNAYAQDYYNSLMALRWDDPDVADKLVWELKKFVTDK